MLRAEKIFHVIENNKVADDFSYGFNPGNIYNILSSNESEIISLLKILGGIEEPDRGSIFVGEKDINSPHVFEDGNIRRKLAYVFETGGLLSNLSIKENLLLPLDFFFPSTSMDEKLEKINYWLKLFNLKDDTLDKRPAGIPRRMAKIFLFIRAYLCSPDIIIYEEPFSNLDINDREIIKEKIIELKKNNQSIQIIKSNTDNYFLLNSDKILIIDDGKVLEDGNLDELKNSSNPITVQLLEYYS